MLSGIQNNGMHFRGTFEPSTLLRCGFDYAKKAAYSEDNKYSADGFANAINYILKETPDTDVFELRRYGDPRLNKVMLTRNGERISDFGSHDICLSVFETITSFLIQEKETLHPNLTPTMEERMHVVDDIYKLTEEYNAKKATLEAKKDELYDKIGLESLKKLRATEREIGLA